MKLSIDRDQCISCGLCWSDCPEIFEEDPVDGWSRIVAEFRIAGDLAKGETPEALREPGQRAAGNCPVSIIHIE
jgi:ferredoxin